MTKRFKIRSSIYTAIAYAYALLYIYAATSKLIDYENFRVQLGQSPLLTAFAAFVALAVPIGEYFIAFLLLYSKLRFLGLWLAFILMSMFTAYIYIILNYSSYVPCSCGGVLEKMTWDEHLAFNIAFQVLGIIAILLSPKKVVATTLDHILS